MEHSFRFGANECQCFVQDKDKDGLLNPRVVPSIMAIISSSYRQLVTPAAEDGGAPDAAARSQCAADVRNAMVVASMIAAHMPAWVAPHVEIIMQVNKPFGTLSISWLAL